MSTHNMIYHGHPDQHFGHISYAQHGEDHMILNLFKLMGVERISYLDLGAHHPQHISNTCLLYKNGHRGVNVDANPNLITLFKVSRPEDISINMGVGTLNSDGEPFYLYSPTSGRNTFCKKEVESLKGVLEVKDTVKLPVATINEIVEAYCNGRFPRLLSCDIEGLDYGVLKSADFQAYGKPNIICVETRRHESTKMKTMLGDRGYLCYCRMGENLIFVDEIFQDVIY